MTQIGADVSEADSFFEEVRGIAVPQGVDVRPAVHAAGCRGLLFRLIGTELDHPSIGNIPEELRAVGQWKPIAFEFRDLQATRVDQLEDVFLVVSSVVACPDVTRTPSRSMGRYGQQHGPTGLEPAHPLVKRGSVFLDVFQHVEGANNSERFLPPRLHCRENLVGTSCNPCNPRRDRKCFG